MFVVFLGAAWALEPSPAPDRPALRRQEAVVEARAIEVATLRANGASRADLAAAMARYREAAVALDALEGPLRTTAEDESLRRGSDALRHLAAALATDRADDDARAAAANWLGEPVSRIGVLEAVLTEVSRTTDPVLRRALAADLAEQAAGLALMSRYDAASAARSASRASSQARALRARTASGQAGGLDLIVAAERAERDAAAAQTARALAMVLATRFEAVGASALLPAEESP